MSRVIHFDLRKSASANTLHVSHCRTAITVLTQRRGKRGPKVPKRSVVWGDHPPIRLAAEQSLPVHWQSHSSEKTPSAVWFGFILLEYLAPLPCTESGQLTVLQWDTSSVFALADFGNRSESRETFIRQICAAKNRALF